MDIRFLTANDASEWWRLRLEALEHDSAAFSASAEEHRKLSLKEVRKRLGSKGGDAFVVGAFEDAHLVGTAGFVRETGLKTRHKGRVWGVYVASQKRGQGVARKMFDALLRRAAGIGGLEQILLSVGTTQTAAVGLYRSLGFESFGCEPKALKIGDRLNDEEYMVLFLNPAARDPAAENLDAK